MMKMKEIKYVLIILLFSNELIAMNDPESNEIVQSWNPQKIGTFLADGFLNLKEGIKIAAKIINEKTPIADPENNSQEDNGDAEVENRSMFNDFIDALFDKIKKSKQDILQEIDRDCEQLSNTVEQKFVVKMFKGTAKGTVLLSLGAFIPFFLIRYVYQYSIHQFKTPHIVHETSLQSGWIETIKWMLSIRPKPCDDLLNNMIFAAETLEYIKEILQFEKLHLLYGEGLDNLLFMGPPGLGKTMIAKALAQSLGLEYVMVSASAFFQENAEIKAMDDIFNDLPKRSKMLIFIDEIDALIINRANLDPDSVGYKILNHFFGYTGTPSKNFLVVGATNRPEIFDEAVHRRFAHVIPFVLPDENLRKHALSFFKDKQLADLQDVNVNAILTNELIQEMARNTEGCSYAELQTIIDQIKSLIRSKNKEISSAAILRIANRVKQKSKQFVKQY